MPLRASFNTSHSLSPCSLTGVGVLCQVTPVAYTRKPQIKIEYDFRRRHFASAATYFMLGARRLTRLMILRPFTVCISDNCAFVRFDVCRRKWLLPPLVRTTLPEPVRRKRLDVALCVFNLILPALALRGILACSFQTKYAGCVCSKP